MNVIHESDQRQQYAALPWRSGEYLEILLISSRETRRWVIPKGWPMGKQAPHDAAAREAFEEAGVRGEIASSPIGTYCYDKLMPDGTLLACRVDVFPLRVKQRMKDWPEKHQRTLRWFTAGEAAAAVKEAGLADLIRLFADTGSYKKK